MSGPQGIGPEALHAYVLYEELHDELDREDLKVYITQLDLHWRTEFEKKRPKKGGDTGNTGPKPPRVVRSPRRR